MKLSAVRLVLPSRVLSNDDVLALVYTNSKHIFSGDLQKSLAVIERMLVYSGAVQRHWCDKNERVLNLLAQAVDNALADADCTKSDIDVLVYASVDRAFAEPANAYFIAHALGFEGVQCFDILDACNGLMRAIQVADGLLRTGAYRGILVINSEFNQFEGGAVYPSSFTLHKPDDIEHHFAGLTLGEGVTATIIEVDQETPTLPQHWEFSGKSRPDLAELCSVPLAGFQRYACPSEKTGHNGIGQFTSYSIPMFSVAVHEMVHLIKQVKTPLADISAIFTHAASETISNECATQLGVQQRIHNVYAQCGNLVSASIPAGIALAINNKELTRGDQMLCCVGSAGMTFSVAYGIF